MIIGLAAVCLIGIFSILTTPANFYAIANTDFIRGGIVTTVRVTLTAYAFAIVGGLFTSVWGVFRRT
ncbi:MAG: hypothetical protein IPJ47_15095 [Anaerolineales bacterium]|nr:hypothetical protein [Anaerolineales bacterium]